MSVGGPLNLTTYSLRKFKINDIHLHVAESGGPLVWGHLRLPARAPLLRRTADAGCQEGSGRVVFGSAGGLRPGGSITAQFTLVGRGCSCPPGAPRETEEYRSLAGHSRRRKRLAPIRAPIRRGTYPGSTFRGHPILGPSHIIPGFCQPRRFNMKKRPNGKLVLSRETLRTLRGPGLGHAHGGVSRYCGETGSETCTSDSCGPDTSCTCTAGYSESCVITCACSHIDTCSCAC